MAGVEHSDMARDEARSSDEPARRSAPVPRSRFGISYTPLMGAVGFAVLGLGFLAWRAIRADDAFMYAASGRWVVENHAVPHTDPFSWTAGGQPWQSNGWLWGVLAWGAFAVGGYAALALLGPVFLVLTAGAVFFAARSFGADRDVAAVATLVATLALVTFTDPRPHMASYACFALALGCGERAYDEGRLRLGWLGGLVGVMVVWANLHGTALLGVVGVGVVVGVRSLYEVTGGRTDVSRGRPLVNAVVVVGATIGAVLVNPYGVDGYRHAADVRAQSHYTITEWFPLWIVGWTSVALAVFVIAAVVAVVIVIRRAGWRRPELVALMVVTGAMAVDSNRIVAYFVIVVAVSGAALVGSSSRLTARGRDPILRVAGLLLLGVALALTAFNLPTLTGPSPGLPVAVVDALPAGCRLLNDGAVGGFLLVRRPDLEVSVDGRNDLYGAGASRRQVQWFEDDSTGGDLADLDRDSVTCVLTVEQPLLVDQLVARGWTRLDVPGPGSGAIAPSRAAPPR